MMGRFPIKYWVRLPRVACERHSLKSHTRVIEESDHEYLCVGNE